jgi:hypothetical protein
MTVQKEMKYCSKCGETKPRSAFHKDRTKKDGLHWCCKKCKNAYTKRHSKRKKYFAEEGKAYAYYDKKQTYLEIECGFCGRELNQGYIVGNYRGKTICRDCVLENECLQDLDVEGDSAELWEKYQRKCKVCGEGLYSGGHKDGTCNRCIAKAGKKRLQGLFSL